MRQNVYILFLSVFAPLLLNAQTGRIISLEYSENDFDIIETEGLVYLNTKNYTAILKNDTSAPALPFICLNVLIGPDESYIDFTFNNAEILLREGITIAPNPTEVFSNENIITPKITLPLIYSRSNYPKIQIEYTGTHMTNGYKFLTFLVCPFRYDFANKKLYLNSRIDLNIQLKSLKNVPIPADIMSGQKQTGKNCFFINEAHKSLLYGKDAIGLVSSKSNTAEDYPYKYLIITSNSLKDEFERLAQWKSTKGVKAKVLTVEDIYGNNPDTTISNQLKIKHAIYDYYEPYHRGIEYVLLGGDVDIVPTQLCYVQAVIGSSTESDETPTDLFYASFKDMNWNKNGNNYSGELTDTLDITSDIAVTRLPVRNTNETKNMINRIISYENMINTNNIVDSILLCGVKINKMYYLPNGGRAISDMEAQSNLLFSDSISPYWPGNACRFYDTFTDHGSGANYDVTSVHLQKELSKGFSFVNVATHGLQWRWDMETTGDYYLRDSASTLVNPRYTVISTNACQTNAFDFVTHCLSETFMRNPMGNILAYYGSSRDAIGDASQTHLGIDLRYIGDFYKKLFSDNSHRYGEAVCKSKNDFIANTNSYNSTRWMYFTLNALGDPEMPLYNSQLTAIPNVLINFNGSDLSCTSGVERPMLCLMSKYDNGNSFYYFNYGHGSPNICDNVFHQMFGEYSFYLTKVGYLPTFALIGNTVHLQNETLLGRNNVIAYHVLIGSNVTNQTATGPVTIENGSTVITIHNDVTITEDFEVKSGAEFEVKITNQNQVTL